MIKSFRHKGLSLLWSTGMTKLIELKFHAKILERLDALDAALRPEDMDLPGYDFHSLQGKPKRYTVHVNGPRCITFEFEDGDAYRVDFEQYH